jgi:hypothetical protein
MRLSLVLRVVCVDADLLEDVLDTRLCFRVLPAVVRIQDRALGKARVREGGVDAPRTLVVHDVGANLTDLFWRSCIVKVVVLIWKYSPRGRRIPREIL